MERLPTRVELRKRKINIENELCVFCGVQEETTNHIFTGCARAVGVWQAVSTWCGIPHIFAFAVKDLMEMHKLIPMSTRRKEVLRGVIIIACWRIWKARNERIFEDRKSSVAEIVADLKALGFLWLKNRQNLYA
ncbi:putative reverse transcriptase zinc-binding domain-containing protein [Helianthus annuus]|nr:putative reverse transcriptase zinc-binding domain-containing protein [Helianthus annuus]